MGEYDSDSKLKDEGGKAGGTGSGGYDGSIMGGVQKEYDKAVKDSYGRAGTGTPPSKGSGE